MGQSSKKQELKAKCWILHELPDLIWLELTCPYGVSDAKSDQDKSLLTRAKYKDLVTSH